MANGSTEVRDNERGPYLCETCFDAFTARVIVQDGLEQAQCAVCGMGESLVAYAQWLEASYPLGLPTLFRGTLFGGGACLGIV